MEVHAPDHPVHSWRDVFTHLGIVTVGLLIALGLEATVEWIHHRHQVRETREALEIEREANKNEIARAAIFFRRQSAALQNNLLVLAYIQQHPGTPPSKLPGALVWHGSTVTPFRAAWATAQQTQVTALMPVDEVRSTELVYTELRTIEEASNAAWIALNTARLYSFETPDPTTLSPAEVSNTIRATEQALAQHFIFGVAVMNLSQNFSDFESGLTPPDLLRLTHTAEVEHNPALAAALAQTIARIDAAGQAKDNFPQASR